MEEKLATAEDEKVEAFCCPGSSNSGCCGSHLITTAKLELKGCASAAGCPSLGHGQTTLPTSFSSSHQSYIWNSFKECFPQGILCGLADVPSSPVTLYRVTWPYYQQCLATTCLLTSLLGFVG